MAIRSLDMYQSDLMLIKARFFLSVAHFCPEIRFWLLQKIRSIQVSPQKVTVIQVHNQE